MEDYWMWLMYRRKILPDQRKKCMEYFGDPKNMFIASSEEIDKLTFLSAPAREEILRSRTEQTLLKEKQELSEKGIHFISIDHPEYPQNLRMIANPPHGLFVKGKIPGFREKRPGSVAIVGARWASHGGILIAKRTARALSRAGIPILSGMASGIDCAAQEEALLEVGKSVGVLGCGPDICYPGANHVLYERLGREGAVISEYPPGTPPAAFRFPLRNRIISGMADVILVVEARKKSGSLITADYALEQGKDVYAVPGRIDDVLSEGCNGLIRQGAGIYCSLEDFLEELEIKDVENSNLRKNQLTLAKSENMVYSCLDFRGQDLESLLFRTGLPREAVLKSLLSLELKDLAEEKAKYYYRK